MNVVVTTRSGYCLISKPTRLLEFLGFMRRIKSADATENNTTIIPELVRRVQGRATNVNGNVLREFARSICNRRA